MRPASCPAPVWASGNRWRLRHPGKPVRAIAHPPRRQDDSRLSRLLRKGCFHRNDLRRRAGRRQEALSRPGRSAPWARRLAHLSRWPGDCLLKGWRGIVATCASRHRAHVFVDARKPGRQVPMLSGEQRLPCRIPSQESSNRNASSRGDCRDGKPMAARMSSRVDDPSGPESAPCPRR